MTNPIEEAARAASKKWQASFNAGDAAGCAACYEEGAVMVAKPLGTFTGRKEIQAFWEKLIGDGFAEVAYKDPKLEALSESSAHLSANWTMNKAHGVITKELWVLQENGEALLREDYFEVQG